MDGDIGGFAQASVGGGMPKAGQSFAGLSFEFDKQPGAIAQYRAIYEEEFRRVGGAVDFRYVEDEHDRRGHVLIVRDTGRCVGGARFNFRLAGMDRKLPIEMSGFDLCDQFAELRGRGCGQIGHVCLLPGYRGGYVTRLMFWHLHRMSTLLGIDDVFGTAVEINARAYRAACFSLGLRNTRIHREIALPPYADCPGLVFHLVRIPVDATPMACVDLHSAGERSLPARIAAHATRDAA